MSFASYVAALVDAIYQQRGEQVAILLDLRGAAVQQAQGAAQRQRGYADLQSVRRLGHSPHLKNFAEAHCQSLLNGPDEGYKQQMAAAKEFKVAFGSEDAGAWMVRPLIKVAQNLHVAAVAAEAAVQDPGTTQGPLESCGGELLALFGAARKRTDDPAKRMGGLAIAITLFRVYVTLNTPQLGRQLISVVASPQFPPFESFPASQRVTYKYYLGRMAILDDKLEEAAEHLEYAFKHCLKSALTNQRRILYYLIPINMVYMRLPSANLLQAHRLSIYEDITEAMRTGNVQQLNQALEQHQYTFIQMGTYLVIEKLRYAVYRRLFRRVHAVHAEWSESGKEHQVPLRAFHAALVWLKDELYQDLEACECLVCNLIFRNYIKGYVSHAQAVVVLSKQNPFPGIDQITLTDPL